LKGTRGLCNTRLVIRVFRAQSGESFHQARERPPTLAAADAATLRVQLVSAKQFDVNDATAIERALAEIDGGGADVVLAPGGSIYRIFPTRRTSEPEASPALRAAPGLPTTVTPRWITRMRGARIVVCGEGEDTVRISHLLDFLGYRARAAQLGGNPDETLERVLREYEAHVVILGDPAPGLVEKAQARQAE
jgi:hypothetical protein